jgi:mono/diheme cytochrome c family protein
MKKTIFTLLLAAIVFGGLSLANAQQEPSQKEESVRLFLEAAKVFQHPRCMNCHPAGNEPTQGMDKHVHIMNVQRGQDDHGNIGMKCSTCHGVENNRFSGVPGAPKWGLAPKSMAWQGLSLHDLCLTLKDPKNIHGMTKEQFIHHNAEDPLVGWGWNPGAGREPVPGTQKQFGETIARWIATGQECP